MKYATFTPSRKLVQLASLLIAVYGLMWPCRTLGGLMWPRMVLILLFTAMTMCGLIRISMDLYSLVWSCLTFYVLVRHFYGLKWHFMVFYGRILSFLAVIDPNSFGLVMYIHCKVYVHLFRKWKAYNRTIVIQVSKKFGTIID